MNLKPSSVIVLISRIVTGLTFLISSVGKFIDSSDAEYLVEMMASQFYSLVEFKPEIVIGLSILEFILAVFLLWGKYVIQALTASFLMLLSLTFVLIYIYSLGFSIESCGCFGSFELFTGFEATLIKNVVLLLLISAGIYFASSLRRDN